MKIQKNQTKYSLLAIWMIVVSLSIGCTIVRPGEPGTSGGGGGGIDLDGGTGGSMIDPEELEPLGVDLLILATFDQSPIADSYSFIIDHLMAQLAIRKIITHKVAIAPMYRRINNTVPLLYGKNAEMPPFDSYNETLNYYTSEEGLNLMDSFSDNDGANLLKLGERLGTTSLYHPLSDTPQGQYYFDTPRDGLVVVWLNGDARRCSLTECQSDNGQALGDALTETDEEGNAQWLKYADNQALPAKKIFHLFVSTEETSDEDDFFESCEDRISFDPTLLDYIAPSRIPLYSQLSDHLDDADLPYDDVDFCKALSLESVASFLFVANSIRGSLNR